MKKSVMFLLLSLVCLSVSAQNGKVKSGVIGGVSMDWYKDEAKKRFPASNRVRSALHLKISKI